MIELPHAPKNAPEFANGLSRRLLAALALVPLIALGACDRPEKIDPLAGGGGLKGEWASDNNIFYANFSDGVFVSRDQSTGGILATGQYLVVSASEVNLNWKSNVTGQENRAKCNRNNAVTLTCTDQQGKTFVLRKRA